MISAPLCVPLLTVLIALQACSSKSAPSESGVNKETSAPADIGETKTDETDEYSDWGAKPVGADLDFRWAFATRDTWVCSKRLESSVCPGPLSSISPGKRFGVSDAIRIVGKAPVNGQWPAIREDKGLKAGWVLASDVEFQPRILSSDKFVPTPGNRDNIATDSNHPSGKVLAASTKVPGGGHGRLVVKKTQKLRFGSWENPQVKQPLLFLDWGEDSIALELPSSLPAPNSSTSMMAWSFLQNHRCVEIGTCNTLSYICDHGYCDEVSFSALFTGTSIDIPEAVRRQWKGAPRTKVPLYELTELVDRFGRYEGRHQPMDGHQWEPFSDRFVEGGRHLKDHVSKHRGLGVFFDFDIGEDSPTKLSGHFCGAKLDAVLAEFEEAFVAYSGASDPPHCWDVDDRTVACRVWGGHDDPSRILIFEKPTGQGQVVLRTIAQTDAETSDIHFEKQEKEMLSKSRRYARKRCPGKSQ